MISKSYFYWVLFLGIIKVISAEGIFHYFKTQNWGIAVIRSKLKIQIISTSDFYQVFYVDELWAYPQSVCFQLNNSKLPNSCHKIITTNWGITSIRSKLRLKKIHPDQNSVKFDMWLYYRHIHTGCFPLVSYLKIDE